MKAGEEAEAKDSILVADSAGLQSGKLTATSRGAAVVWCWNTAFWLPKLNQDTPEKEGK